MAQKKAPITATELDRAKALCIAAVEANGGQGVTVPCTSLSSAMHLRQLVYRARQHIRRHENSTSTEPVCTVDMRIVDNENGGCDLKIFPPGQFLRDLHILNNVTGKPIELADNEDSEASEDNRIIATIGADTAQEWLAGILKETMAKPVREAIRRADLSVRDAYLLDWEELAQLLYESGIRATRQPKFYSDPSPPPLTQERHR